MGLPAGACTTYSVESPRVVALDGRVSESLVYRVDVPETAWWLTLQLHDTLPTVAVESGLDVDAVIVSDVQCTTAACVQELEGRAGVNIILMPGAIQGSSDPTARLVGTTPGGQFVDPRASTPDHLDANREHRAGYVSVGQDGGLLVGFDPPLERKDHVYIALAGRPGFPGQQSDDPLLLPIAGRPLPVSMFGTSVRLTSPGPRETLDSTVAAQRSATLPCAQEARYRSELEAAATRAASCVRPHHPEIAARVDQLDLGTLAISCYASDSDPGCGVAGPDHIHLDSRKLDAAPADACGGSRQTVFAGLEGQRERAPALAWTRSCARCSAGARR